MQRRSGKTKSRANVLFALLCPYRPENVKENHVGELFLNSLG